MASGNPHSKEAAPCRGKARVMLEMEDPLEEQHGPSSPSLQQWNASNDTFYSYSSTHEILDELSPLHLRLGNSPSFLHLTQAKLSQGSMVIANSENVKLKFGVEKERQGSAASGSVQKLTASNFPATLLRIGSWEYKSKHEGHLVAKFYFATQKLVWEFAGTLKSKIEITWDNIVELKANCPDNGPSSLTVVLYRQPFFFREYGQPTRNRTNWQETSDFTDGQASKYRQHFLQCPQGKLTRHFEKLIQSHKRLYALSQQPEIILDSPYFDTRSYAFENLDNLKDRYLHQVNPGITLDGLSREAPSPNSDYEILLQHLSKIDDPLTTLTLAPPGTRVGGSGEGLISPK